MLSEEAMGGPLWTSSPLLLPCLSPLPAAPPRTLPVGRFCSLSLFLTLLMCRSAAVVWVLAHSELSDLPHDWKNRARAAISEKSSPEIIIQVGVSGCLPPQSGDEPSC